MKQTDFESLVETVNPSLCLVDASGVLYNDHGSVEGAAAALDWVRRRGCRVVLVTNNTNQWVQDISEKLAKNGFLIPPEDILSSGRGLALDDTIQKKIQHKRVFVFGRRRSWPYVEAANPAQIVDDPDQAEVFVMTASFKDQDETLEKMRLRLIKEPVLPLICANPDFYVQTQTVKTPVCGYYAQQLHTETGCVVDWMGKPHPQFSQVVRRYLSEGLGLEADSSTIFFDDNPVNIRQLCQDLGVLGCVVLETGLSYSYRDQLDHPNFREISFGIPRLIK